MGLSCLFKLPANASIYDFHIHAYISSMNNSQITDNLTQRLEEMKQMKKILENDPVMKREEYVVLRKVSGKTRFYKKAGKSDVNGKYLGQKEICTTRELARKYRNEKYLKAVNKEIDMLSQCLDNMKTIQDSGVDSVWGKLPDAVKAFNEPPSGTDEEYAARWQKQKVYREYRLKKTAFKTLRGEYVQSKSELIIADRLNNAGVPYIYTMNVNLHTEREYSYVQQPDFTVLNKRTGQVFFWEHLGMMDNRNYVAKNIHKIVEYGRAGYFPGKKLLLTFESTDCALNVEYVERIIKEFLL